MRRLLVILGLPALAACGGDTTLVSDAPGVERHCDDGADDDLDGAFDCADPDCTADPACAGGGPGAPTVVVSPGAPTSADDLTCAVSDPAAWDGLGPVDYAFSWLRSGVQTGISSERVSSAATARGEAWTCVVTPEADGHAGAPGTAAVTVGNAPPAGAEAAISPAAPREGVDPLLCAVATPARDADGDPVTYAVLWTVDGVPHADTETDRWPGDAVPAGTARAGETWVCTLTPSDPAGPGVAATATATIAACDEDGDGYASIGCGGADCDDGQPGVHPGATEVCDNGMDDDCDGTANACRLAGEWSVDDAAAWRTGEKAGDLAGARVVGGHDLDGDGCADWIVGGYGFDGPGATSGAAWVLRGPLGGSGSLADADARLLGEGPGDFAGIELASGADLTGDGVLDVLVGASGANARADDGGTTYLVAGPVSGTLGLGAATARVDGTVAHMRLGSGVAVLADTDGAGRPGALLGAYGVTAGGRSAGAAFVFAQPLSGELDQDDALARITGDGDDAVGAHLTTGDVDGDGITDAVFGVPEHSGAAVRAGAVFVAYGPFSGERSLADADAMLEGESISDNAGQGVAVVGDVNADGLADALVGARGVGVSGGGTRDGQAYVVLGPMTVDGLYAAQAELRGESGGDRAGQVVGRAGDVDGDGFDDMLVSSTNNRSGGEYAGAAYLVYGPVTGRVPLGTTGAAIRGRTGDFVGTGLAGGDHDGDGDADLLIGAFYEDAAGEAAGAVFLFEGAGL